MNRLVANVNVFIKAISWATAKVKFRLLIREGFVIGIFINSNLAKEFQNNVCVCVCVCVHLIPLIWLTVIPVLIHCAPDIANLI